MSFVSFPTYVKFYRRLFTNLAKVKIILLVFNPRILRIDTNKWVQ